MTPPFRHIILTRFNVQVGFAPAPQRLDDDWLKARLEPFLKYTVPSVRSQEDAEVHWLVFFDEQSPDWFRSKIAELSDVLTPIFVTGYLTDELMATNVAASGLVDRPSLITTRLDSDDALARTYAATVQGAFAGQERQFVELPIGVQYYRGSLYTAIWRSNSIISLIEKVGPGGAFSTVFCMPHDQVLATQSVLTMWRSPQWWQTLHGANTTSQLRPSIPRLSTKPHPSFVCAPNADEGGSSLTRLRAYIRAVAGFGPRALTRVQRKLQASLR